MWPIDQMYIELGFSLNGLDGSSQIYLQQKTFAQFDSKIDGVGHFCWHNSYFAFKSLSKVYTVQCMYLDSNMTVTL